MSAPVQVETAPDPEESAQRADRVIEWLRDWGERLPATQMDERRCMPPHVVLDLARQGLFGLLVPRAYGGRPMRTHDVLRIVEQLAAIDLTLGSFYGVDVALGVRPIARLGSAAAKARFLPELAAGRMLAGLALTEPGAGSDPRSLRARVLPRGAGVALFGHKYLIGNAGWSGVLNVYARAGRGADARIVGYCVPQDAPGVLQGTEHKTLGMRAMIQNEVVFSGVALGPELELSGGVAGLLDTLHFGRLGIVALALGAMQRSAQLAVRFSSRRTIGAGSLSSHPVTLDRVHAMQAAIELARGVLARLAPSVDAGVVEDPAWFAAAKITVPELCFEVVDDALGLLGGRGYIEGNGLARRFRDARLLRIFEGPTEALRSHLGMRAIVDSRVAALLEGEASGRLEALREEARAVSRDRRLEASVRRARTMRLAYTLGDWVAFALVGQSLPEGSASRALAASRRFAAEARFFAVLERKASGRGEPPLLELAARWRGAIGEVDERGPGVDVLVRRR